MEVGFGQMDFPGAPWRPYWKKGLKNERGDWDIEAGEKKINVWESTSDFSHSKYNPPSRS
jgi:hypothetical protein